MRRLLILLMLASPAFGHEYTFYHPNVPSPKIIELAPPQTNTFCANNLTCTVSAAWSFSSSSAVSLAMCRTPGVWYVDAANTCAWAGADAGAQMNSAIASMPTLNTFHVGVLDIRGLGTNGTVTLSTTVNAGSPYLLIIGPGHGSLVFNCTVTAATGCFNTQEGVNFTTAPGFRMGGFTILGQGAANANAVGLHAGDMVSGEFYDIQIDNFLGANSSCVWLDNVNGFYEKNVMQILTSTHQGSQNGCTKNWRFTNSAGVVGSSSFARTYIFDTSTVVVSGSTGISVESGSVYDNVWEFVGNAGNGVGTTVLSVSGTVNGAGGGSATTVEGNLFIGVECSSCATPGTFIKTAASGNTITIRAGGFHENSGTMTNSLVGNIIQASTDISGAATASANVASNPLVVRGRIWNGSTSIVDQIQFQTTYATGANPVSTFTVNHAGSSGASQTDWSNFGHFATNDLSIGGAVGASNIAHFGFNGGTVSGISGALYEADNQNVAFLQTVDKSGNMGLAGGIRVGGVSSLAGSTVALTADWTCGTGGTVASCTSATIIGSGGGVPLTFTLPSIAASYTLECDGVVGQATAATANQWNLLTATNGATNVTANYTMATAATAYAAGAVTDQASTTTTFQITPSWTLGGVGTKMPFHIWAKIEGASASGTVVSLQLLAPTVGDLVTIFRGAACTVF